MKTSPRKGWLAAIAVLVAVTSFGLVLRLDLVRLAQAQEREQPAPRVATRTLLDPDDAVILLLDHQTGLFQTVRDIPLHELRSNTIALARVGELAKVPVLLTASEPRGPNGPLIEGLQEAAPSGRYLGRKGEISALDNAEFRRAVEATGRRTLIMAGVWTSVCVAFPALQAQAEGYTVYAVIDASGDVSELAARTAMDRMTQAGVIPIAVNGVVSELQRTWARPDAAAWGALYRELVPGYDLAAESHEGAQEATGRGSK